MEIIRFTGNDRIIPIGISNDIVQRHAQDASEWHDDLRRSTARRKPTKTFLSLLRLLLQSSFHLLVPSPPSLPVPSTIGHFHRTNRNRWIPTPTAPTLETLESGGGEYVPLPQTCPRTRRKITKEITLDISSHASFHIDRQAENDVERSRTSK